MNQDPDKNLNQSGRLGPDRNHSERTVSPIPLMFGAVSIFIFALIGYYGTVLADGGIYGSGDGRPELGLFVGLLIGAAIFLVVSAVSFLPSRRTREVGS